MPCLWSAAGEKICRTNLPSCKSYSLVPFERLCEENISWFSSPWKNSVCCSTKLNEVICFANSNKSSASQTLFQRLKLKRVLWDSEKSIIPSLPWCLSLHLLLCSQCFIQVSGKAFSLFLSFSFLSRDFVVWPNKRLAAHIHTETVSRKRRAQYSPNMHETNNSGTDRLTVCISFSHTKTVP